MTSRRVLFIDSDADSRQIYSLLLNHNGYRVVLATGIEEGLRAAREETPAVIVTELFVRTARGWTILEALKGDASTAKIPVIALSAYVLPDDRLRASVADVFLPKPCEAGCVLQEVHRLCRRDESEILCGGGTS
jgi:CheY-like chemotaxis protein